MQPLIGLRDFAYDHTSGDDGSSGLQQPVVLGHNQRDRTAFRVFVEPGFPGRGVIYPCSLAGSGQELEACHLIVLVEHPADHVRSALDLDVPADGQVHSGCPRGRHFEGQGLQSGGCVHGSDHIEDEFVSALTLNKQLPRPGIVTTQGGPPTVEGGPPQTDAGKSQVQHVMAFQQTVQGDPAGKLRPVGADDDLVLCRYRYHRPVLHERNRRVVSRCFAGFFKKGLVLFASEQHSLGLIFKQDAQMFEGHEDLANRLGIVVEGDCGSEGGGRSDQRPGADECGQ